MQLPFQITNEKKQILGMLHLPVHAGSMNPIVILCYGMNGNTIENGQMLIHVATELEKLGIAFVRFDYCGLGSSDGEFWDVSHKSKVFDVLSVIHHVKNCYLIDGCKIVLIGFSDGANIATLCAKEFPDLLGMIYWNPVFEISVSNTSVAEAMPLKPFRNPYNNKLVFNLLGNMCNVNYLKEIRTPPVFLGHVPCKQVALFSEKDDISSYTHKLLLSDYNIRCETVSSESHVFVELSAQLELAKKTADIIYGWI